MATAATAAVQALKDQDDPTPGVSSQSIATSSRFVALKNETPFAKLSENKYFENSTLLVIVLNAFWICIDVQWNHANLRENGKLPLEPASTIVENIFCFYFTFEVIIRFLAFLTKWKCIFDAWFVFDSILVTFMVLETWVLPIMDHFSGKGSEGGVLSNFSSFRLLRLLRLTRMARIMRFFPELMTIVKGMVNAMKAVFFILLFLVIVMYVFAIVFTNQLGKPNGSEQEPSEDGCDGDPTAIMMFASLGSSMMTLFTNGVLGDNLAQTLGAIKDADDGLILMWLFIGFMIVSSITLLNMLIGVLCQVVDETAQKEDEINQIFELQTCLTNAFKLIDEDHSGVISAEEWRKISGNKEVRESLKQLGVEESHLDERLAQMEHTLFGRKMDSQEDPGLGSTTPKKAAMQGVKTDSTAGGRQTMEPQPEAGKQGLSYDQFIDKVVDLRWDTPTSALDLEMLKRSVLQENKKVRGRLDSVEQKLSKILTLMENGAGKSGVEGLTAPNDTPFNSWQPPAAQHNHAAAPQLPGAVPSPPAGGAGQLTQSPSGNTARPLCLREVPTELLFHMLKTRSPSDAADCF